MKIIIWGLGFRGRTLIDYLGNQYIEAIVESDLQKVGTKYKGIEVISFEKYMEVYFDWVRHCYFRMDIFIFILSLV